MGQTAAKDKSNQDVRFSTDEEGPPRYSSHQFGSTLNQNHDLRIPPTIVVSDEESRFVSAVSSSSLDFKVYECQSQQPQFCHVQFCLLSF